MLGQIKPIAGSVCRSSEILVHFYVPGAVTNQRLPDLVHPAATAL
jgi:hypothetical protein